MRRILLASVSTLALITSASAADMSMPVKAPPRVTLVPPPLWAGPYIGLNIGAARHHWSFEDVDGFIFPRNDTFWSTSKTGFTIGGQIGWNWQWGNFVYGVEADGNWIDAKADARFARFCCELAHAVSELNWLSTFRARVGVAVDRTLFYVTGGLALAGINDRWGTTSRNGAPDTLACACLFVRDETRAGGTVGGGIEHRFAPQWTGRAEILYAAFGHESASFINPRNGRTYRSEFSNSLITARGGVNYKW
jgi:outer membrane immunogenic protein